MRRLILFRHAKSDWTGQGVDDHDRPLAPRGKRVAGPMGAWLVGRGFKPEHVLCSTARRARATWDLAKVALTPAPKPRFEKDIYMATPDVLLQQVKAIPADAQTAMIVGHNPGLENFAKMLASKGDPEARRTLSEKFPTAAIAVIDFPFDDWAYVKADSGRLDRFVTPRSLGLGEA